jgi:hypothetical protein
VEERAHYRSLRDKIISRLAVRSNGIKYHNVTNKCNEIRHPISGSGVFLESPLKGKFYRTTSTTQPDAQIPVHRLTCYCPSVISAESANSSG